MNCRWKYAAAPEELIKSLAKELKCSLPLAEVLWKRGLCDPEAGSAFLSPKLANLSDPFDIPGMKEAAERLIAALAAGRRIVIYCDYDVDGLTSAALLWRCLAAHGLTPAAFLPDRMAEGYGLTAKALERCIQSKKPELLVVLDCGTNSRAEIDEARKLGIETIVVDHHEPENPAKPDVLINPKLANIEHRTSNIELCTAGLAFKLCHAFLKLTGTDRFDLKDHLDLAALGTIADVASLTGENRILVSHGLKRLGATRNPGLKALMAIADVSGTPTAYDCGFKLGPRLNAAGRLESAEAALELLVTGEAARAGEIASRLDLINRERRALQEKIYQEAVEMAQVQFQGDGRVLVVAKEGWHAGVVGIVAAKLAQRFHRPAFVIALDDRQGVGKGSGRSIEGFHLIDALNGARDFLTAGGGHTMAVGVTLAASSVAGFRACLDSWAKQLPDESVWQRSLAIDLELPLTSLTLDLAEELERVGPFGSGNPPVLIAARGARVQTMKRVGSDGKHLSLVLEMGGSRFRSIFFQFEDRRAPAVGQPVDAVFELKKDQYQGFVNIQGLLRDLTVA